MFVIVFVFYMCAQYRKSMCIALMEEIHGAVTSVILNLLVVCLYKHQWKGVITICNDQGRSE